MNRPHAWNGQSNSGPGKRVVICRRSFFVMSVLLNHLKSKAASPLRHARRRVENCGLALLGLLLLLASGSASAFPPAPYYTLYGMVRDQVGQTVTAEGAEVILLKGGAEVGRTPITANQLDQGYELNVRIDQNRNGTTFYTEKAVAAGGLFSMVVSMNGEFLWLCADSHNHNYANMRLMRR
jgi:hypothetical protein